VNNAENVEVKVNTNVGNVGMMNKQMGLPFPPGVNANPTFMYGNMNFPFRGMMPNQGGNVNPQQMNPQQMNPQQMNPQQMNPQQMNPQQMNPQQMNPQQMNPQQMNPQQMNPQQMNPQQMNQNQMQQMSPQQMQQYVAFQQQRAFMEMNMRAGMVHGINQQQQGNVNQSENKDDPPKVKSPRSEVKKEDNDNSGDGSDQDSDQEEVNKSKQENQPTNQGPPIPTPQNPNFDNFQNQMHQNMSMNPHAIPGMGQFPFPPMNYPPNFMPGRFPQQGWPPGKMIPNFQMPPHQGQFNPSIPIPYKGNFDTYMDIDPNNIKYLESFPPPDPILEKLPASKTPVIDAFIYCSISNWGVSIKPSPERLPSTFVINDFNKYWELSQKICSKPAPTETQVARLKALRRWFADFPGIKKIKSVKEGKEPIVIKVKPERMNEVITIIKKYSQMINTRCKTITGGQ
jgi:hypothetical protein